MIKLEMSDVLHRRIRRSDVAELAIPNWDLVSEAIKAGRTDEALEFLEYCREGSQANNDGLISVENMFITRLASFGEEEVMKIFRERYYPRTKERLSVTHGAEGVLELITEIHRFHHSNFTVTEEPDRYVVTLDP